LGFINHTNKGTVIAGANASRWIQVPFLGLRSNINLLASMVCLLLGIYLGKRVPDFKSYGAGTLVSCFVLNIYFAC
jgi:cell division protein FtsW